MFEVCLEPPDFSWLGMKGTGRIRTADGGFADLCRRYAKRYPSRAYAFRPSALPTYCPPTLVVSIRLTGGFRRLAVPARRDPLRHRGDRPGLETIPVRRIKTILHCGRPFDRQRRRVTQEGAPRRGAQ